MITCARCSTQNPEGSRFCNSCGAPLAAMPAAPEVRKTVTVMFMDVVGSTALGERTDPETLRRVMTSYFDEIRGVVERHGGTVEKYIGDAVMAVFGVPVVHEDDALRAVRAAVEIRGRLAALGDQMRAERGFSVEWRTGINTGEVVAGDAGMGQRFVTGDAVNVAARLEQGASATEILLGLETYALVRDIVLAEPVGPLAAKGKAEALTAFRLIDLVSGEVQASRRLDSPMIGRQRQQRQLAQAFEQVVDERVCYLFTVLGSAGVGKSRLVGEFLASVEGKAQILHGRCLSYGDGITYWPIAEAIREAAGIGDDTDDEVREKLAALVDDEANRQVVVQRLGEILGRLHGTASAEETFWAVRTTLESVARRKPVVLVLDDIHWAEATMLDLIEHLADWTQDAPLLVLCVARQELLENRSGWAGGKAYASTLTLEPLNETESRELMVALLGHVEVSPELVDKIGAAAEGNPLFVEQMIGMLVDNGYLIREGGRWRAARALDEVAVPPTIQALLAARLDRLPSPERAVIERGSVEGKTFHRGAVAELAPDSLRESVPAHLRALSRKELVRPDRSDFAGDEAFRFRHLLIRDAAYAAMPKEARADLHARFAAWLERVAADHVEEYEEIIGYHFEQAYRYRAELGPLDDRGRELGEAAARHLYASGKRASARGDVRASIKLLRTAVELMPPGFSGRTLAVARYADALNGTGDVRAAANLTEAELELARQAGDEYGVAALEIVRMWAKTTLGELTIQDVIDRSEELMPVVERAGDVWLIEQATVSLGTHLFFQGHADRARRTYRAVLDRYPDLRGSTPLIGWELSAMYYGPTPVEEALAHAARIDITASRSLEASVSRVMGSLRGLLGQFDEARALLSRSLELELDLGRTVGVDSMAGHFHGPLEVAAGNYAEAERLLLGSFERMTARGDTGFSSTVAGYLAGLYVRLGRWEDAERYARISMETGDADDVDAQGNGLAALARVQAAHGELELAEETAQRAVAIAEATDYLHNRGRALLDLAEVQLAAGRRHDALASLRRSLENYQAKGATVHIERVRTRLAEIEGHAGA
jgi:class 3 adenylate cyclase/tetratricopeptide (TPR) repeat protein